MGTKNRISNAERLGRTLGRGSRAYMRGECQIVDGLVTRGVPAGIAAALLWGVKLAVVGVLLYTAFWLTLLLVLVVLATWGFQQQNTEQEDFLGRDVQERDHRQSLFYHPASYNDDPDPRFEDD